MNAFPTERTRKQPHYWPSSGGLLDSSGGLENSSGGLGDSIGGLTASIGGLDPLKAIAQPISSRKKASKVEVEQAIIQMCRLQPCTLELLAELLNRSDNLIRKDYLQPMIRDRRLRFLYPTMPRHPEQAYIADEGE